MVTTSPKSKVRSAKASDLAQRLDEKLKKDFNGKSLSKFLKRAGLPKDYPSLTEADARAARFKVFGSWWDANKPHLLCTDVDKYLQSHFLYVEYYIRPVHQDVYFWQDAGNKYEMLRMVMSPPVVPTEPAMSIVTATRRTGKTQGIIVEAMPHMCLVRPHTLCLLSEYNDERTKEELGKIKDILESNERIHQDFGGRGVLFPRNKAGWSTHELKFIHSDRTAIRAHSMNSAQRGRGPLFGVLDDPEDDDTSYNREWRTDFFSKLFGVYKNMFHFGGKFCWIGTPIHAASCLALAMKGMAETSPEDENPSMDPRFVSWRKGNFSIIYKDDKGNYQSHQPERISVEAFLKKMEIDPINTQKEILCLPVTPGTRAFKFHPHTHGYMHCVAQEDSDKYAKGNEYFLDLKSGTEMPWKKFLDSLRVFGAGDQATGTSPDCDDGALAYIGVDPDRNVYVLDCWLGKVFSDVQIQIAYSLAEMWECGIMGWEKAGLTLVINRLAHAHVVKLREQGKSPPVFVELENAGKNKVRRVLTMIPLFGNHQIRFRCFDVIQGPDGRKHHPAAFTNRAAYTELTAQVQEYTDQGIKGHDDAIDALEMAVRLAGNLRGQVIEENDANRLEFIVKRWQKLGASISMDTLPRHLWTEKQYAKSQQIRKYQDVIPYV